MEVWNSCVWNGCCCHPDWAWLWACDLKLFSTLSPTSQCPTAVLNTSKALDKALEMAMGWLSRLVRVNFKKLDIFEFSECSVFRHTGCAFSVSCKLLQSASLVPETEAWELLFSNHVWRLDMFIHVNGKFSVQNWTIHPPPWDLTLTNHELVLCKLLHANLESFFLLDWFVLWSLFW